MGHLVVERVVVDVARGLTPGDAAVWLGAAGVLVAGCEFPTCHYIEGNYAAEKRLKRAQKKLAKAGFDPQKLWNVWCSAADGPKFANTMRTMVKDLGL